MYDMIKVIIPYDNVSERSYAVKQTFSILGLDCMISVDERLSDYIVSCGDGRVIVKDSFFAAHKEKKSYLSISNIPQNIEFTTNGFVPGDDIPVIFGTGRVVEKGSTVECGIDVFASVFFMLSRWEEYVSDNKDQHSRFPVAESLAFKAGFISRPVVNELCLMLLNMISYVSCCSLRATGKFSVIYTHDIDLFAQASTRNLLRSIYYRKGLGYMLATLRGLINFDKDMYNQYSYLMDQSEMRGGKSIFFFMTEGCPLRSVGFRKTIAEILKRGHTVGFHPGYGTYSNEQLWKRQLELLKEASGIDIAESRQHVLQVAVPSTFRIWENNGIEIDSTLCYAEYAGFRCGTGNVFNLYDVENSKMLNVRERPLIVMDVTLRHYEKLTPDRARVRISEIKRVCKLFETPMTLLIHNSNLCGNGWDEWKKMYEEIC